MGILGKGRSSRKYDLDPEQVYTLKKCPYCFGMLNLDQDRCDACKRRVGKLNKAGFADKPIDWKSYAYCVFSWALFAFYAWWAFFRK